MHARFSNRQPNALAFRNNTTPSFFFIFSLFQYSTASGAPTKNEFLKKEKKNLKLHRNFIKLKSNHTLNYTSHPWREQILVKYAFS